MVALCVAASVGAFAVVAAEQGQAASLVIEDGSLEGSIICNVGQFDRGVGFVLDGTTILAPSLGTASATVSEGTAATGPITHTFTGQFLTSGALIPRNRHIVYRTATML